MQRRKADAGQGRARYLVQFGLVAVFDAGLAGRYGRSADFLSNQLADQRLRHFIFLGRADDHDGAASGSGRERKRSNSLTAVVFAFAGAHGGRREDVEDQGHWGGSLAVDAAIRNGRVALHAGEHGGAGDGHRADRGPDPGRARVREQDLERGAVFVHESGESRERGNHFGFGGGSRNSREGAVRGEGRRRIGASLDFFAAGGDGDRSE